MAASSPRDPFGSAQGVPQPKLRQYRCKLCHRVLFEAAAEGRLVVVCKRCRSSQEVRLTPSG